uniref:Biogenesis of lysosome-related organelles complex 1 subunit 1 n=1 Tax=Schistocephalus solidus TaxID=70667 RepID=A0A183T7D7_SCHSO
LHASKGLAGFGDPMGDLIVDFGAVGEIAAQEREGIHRFQLSAIDIDSTEEEKFDRHLLKNVSEAYEKRLSERKAALELQRQRALEATTALVFQLSNNLNDEVSLAYRNQCRLNAEVKRLHRNAHLFTNEVNLWVKEISDFNKALKELGDVENWSRKLAVDVQILHDTLRLVDDEGQ